MLNIIIQADKPPNRWVVVTSDMAISAIIVVKAGGVKALAGRGGEKENSKVKTGILSLISML